MSWNANDGPRTAGSFKICFSRSIGSVGAVVPYSLVSARQRQILQAGITAVLARYNVVGVEGRRIGGFGYLAIFAAPLGAIADGAGQALIQCSSDPSL
jgi:hypothetical protein